MSVGLTLDWREFDKAAEVRLAISSRTYPEFANGQMLRITSWAIQETIAANANAIATLLGQVATKIGYTTKKGTYKRYKRSKRVYSTEETSVAARIINSKLWKEGKVRLWGSDLANAVRRMIGARISAVGFIRSGWIYAVRDLSRVVGYTVGNKSSTAHQVARMKGKAKGYAIPATVKYNDMVTCIAVNSALVEVSSRNPEHHSNPDAIAVPGFQRAIDRCTADMMQDLKNRVDKIWNAS